MKNSFVTGNMFFFHALMNVCVRVRSVYLKLRICRIERSFNYVIGKKNSFKVFDECLGSEAHFKLARK